MFISKTKFTALRRSISELEITVKALSAEFSETAQTVEEISELLETTADQRRVEKAYADGLSSIFGFSGVVNSAK